MLDTSSQPASESIKCAKQANKYDIIVFIDYAEVFHIVLLQQVEQALYVVFDRLFYQYL